MDAFADFHQAPKEEGAMALGWITARAATPYL